MSGILANSSSVDMSASATTSTGYIVEEQIAFTLDVSGASYAWEITKPSDSTSRAALSAKTDASCTFVPDVAGYYVAVCRVDATTYRLRFSVVDQAPVTFDGARRWVARIAASVPPPSHADDLTLFLDSATGRFKTKNSAGAVADLATPNTLRSRSTALPQQGTIEVWGADTSDQSDRTRINLHRHDPREKDYGAVADGVTDDYAALLAADTAAAAAGEPLHISGTLLVGTSIALSARVEFAPDGKLKPANGVTITINGKISAAPTQQIFDVSLWDLASATPPIILAEGALKVVHPEHWGAVADGNESDGSGTDNYPALKAMRDACHAWARVRCEMHGNYAYSKPYWIMGWDRLHLVGPATLFCTTETANGDGRGLNTASPFSTMVVGDDTFVGSSVNTGDKIDSVVAGDTVATLKTGSRESAYSVGSLVLLYGFSQQGTGSPPNGRYSFVREVVGVTSDGSGVVTLDAGAPDDLNENWWDFGDGTAGEGAARMLPLPQYSYAREIVLEDIRVAAKGTWTHRTINGSIQVRARKVVLRNVECGYFDPSIGDEVTCYNCTFDYVEPDKLLGVCTLIDCRVNFLTQGTGVQYWEMRGGSVGGMGEFAPRRSRWTHVRFDTIDPLHVATSHTYRGASSWYVERIDLVDCVLGTQIINGTANNEGLVYGGSTNSLTVDSVSSASKMLVVVADASAVGDIQRVLAKGVLLHGKYPGDQLDASISNDTTTYTRNNCTQTTGQTDPSGVTTDACKYTDTSDGGATNHALAAAIVNQFNSNAGIRVWFKAGTIEGLEVEFGGTGDTIFLGGDNATAEGATGNATATLLSGSAGDWQQWEVHGDQSGAFADFHFAKRVAGTLTRLYTGDAAGTIYLGTGATYGPTYIQERGKSGRVTDMYQEDATHLAIEAEWNKAPLAGEVYKWSGTQEINVDAQQGSGPGYVGPAFSYWNQDRWTARTKGRIELVTFGLDDFPRRTSGDTYAELTLSGFRGRIRRIWLEVARAYSGASAHCYLRLKDLVSDSASGGRTVQTFDLATVGVRDVTDDGVSGSVGEDSLSATDSTIYTELGLRLTTGSGMWEWASYDENPQFLIAIEVVRYR